MVKEDTKKGAPGSAGRVVELFAGVGGFRLGLESAGWQTVWANQWEPGTKTQHAADCYRSHWDDGSLVNEDIAKVLDEIEAGDRDPIPDHDFLVGGFPCQDYSVAKTLSQAEGIRGKKGVLWWQIHKILETKRPRMLFLENVDRLLKSPASQRGRDFAIILACLSDLGYMAEWRVVNAADYGFPQRRRRVFIVGHQVGVGVQPRWNGPLPWLYQDGALALGTPVWPADDTVTRLDPDARDLQLKGHPAQITQEFGWSNAVSPFLNAGVMCDRQVWTRKVEPNFDGKFETLRDILVDEADVPEAYFIPERQMQQWAYLKGPKREERTAANGHQYHYAEGGIAFPDPLDRASRTVLTGEGGSTPSRFKHVIQASDGRLRRLMPVELERLNGFPDDWTNTGMPDGRRAFMMGNALVVGLVRQAAAPLAGGSLLARHSPLKLA
ncbi:MAG: (cytosine-5)-methyltransferase 1 [Actinomycetota bacterium]|nr:(cytosine-5)-methyltransferase 1 [Actinomycetota bacterium]